MNLEKIHTLAEHAEAALIAEALINRSRLEGTRVVLVMSGENTLLNHIRAVIG